MKVGSLFAGIGGFDLGFEWAGDFEIAWQVEIDEFCQRVLAKHWPTVTRYGDIREVHATGLCGTGTVCPWCLAPVDVLCGGFPCQDISDAGKRAGLDGARSGLWRQMFRLVRELRPSYVVVENVSALLERGFGRVVGDLASIGYDAEWDSLSACMFGAPHLRERVFIVAYPYAGDRRAPRAYQAETAAPELLVCGDREARRLSDWFATEPAVDRMVHGLPDVVDRIRPYGNVVIPQIAAYIAHRIKVAEGLAA